MSDSYIEPKHNIYSSGQTSENYKLLVDYVIYVTVNSDDITYCRIDEALRTAKMSSQPTTRGSISCTI